MSITNLFGEIEYSKEEKVKIEQEKQAEKQNQLKLDIKKKEVLKKLQKLPKEEFEQIKEDINSFKTIEEVDKCWASHEQQYNDIVTKEEEKKKAKEETEAKTKEGKKYKYPFLMYFGHEYRDVTGVFEEGKEYTGKELVAELVKHGFKDFKYAQDISWEYFDDENCLYPKFKLGNRG